MSSKHQENPTRIFPAQWPTVRQSAYVVYCLPSNPLGKSPRKPVAWKVSCCHLLSDGDQLWSSLLRLHPVECLFFGLQPLIEHVAIIAHLQVPAPVRVFDGWKNVPELFGILRPSKNQHRHRSQRGGGLWRHFKQYCLAGFLCIQSKPNQAF